MRFATLRIGQDVVGVVVDGDSAYQLPSALSVGDLVGLGLDRALEIGTEALAGQGIALDGGALALPYKPPSVRDFVTFESHVEGVLTDPEKHAGMQRFRR